ncbi:MAG: hypothetical protein ACYCUG_04985 [Acidimicrobiales bacterium]
MVTGRYGKESLAVSVPAGAFTAPTQVTVYAPTDLGSRAAAGIAVEFTDPATGAAVSGTLAKPVVVTLS